jgi:cytochrome d ubiquinol oxidase subunit II
VALSVYMGAVTVMNGAEGEMWQRARKLSMIAAIVGVVLFAIGGFWVHGMEGYKLVAGPSGNLDQTPLQQTVTQVSGAWYANYAAHPILWLVPLVGFAGFIVGALAARGGRSHLAWWLGALGWIGVIGSVGVSMFPFMMPSSSDPSQSLTLWNASSSQLTLTWMVGFTVVFVPLILWYTGWAFYVMRGKVKPEHVAADEHAY